MSKHFNNPAINAIIAGADDSFAYFTETMHWDGLLTSLNVDLRRIGEIRPPGTRPWPEDRATSYLFIANLYDLRRVLFGFGQIVVHESVKANLERLVTCEFQPAIMTGAFWVPVVPGIDPSQYVKVPADLVGSEVAHHVIKKYECKPTNDRWYRLHYKSMRDLGYGPEMVKFTAFGGVVKECFSVARDLEVSEAHIKQHGLIGAGHFCCRSDVFRILAPEMSMPYVISDARRYSK
jgi:hypothetical protein